MKKKLLFIILILALILVFTSGCNFKKASNINQLVTNQNINSVTQPSSNLNNNLNTNIFAQCVGAGLPVGSGICCPELTLKDGLCNKPFPLNCAQIGQAPTPTIKCCSGLTLQNGICNTPPATCAKEGQALSSSLTKCCADLILQKGVCSKPACKIDSDCYPAGFKPGKCGTFYQCKSNKCYSGSTKCPPACTPNCSGKICGSDGCGGICGSCLPPLTCSADGTVCFAPPPPCPPDCLGKICGSDGCGGICGSCLPPLTCSADGTECLAPPPGCTPDCTGKTCGDDGCGGSCGTCASNQMCTNGNCTNCISPGSLDTSTPSKQILIGNSSFFDIYLSVMTIKLQASSAEDLYLNEVKVTDTAAINPVARAWYLYSSSRSDCSSISDPIATAPGGSMADFKIPTASVTIPHSGSIILVVKIDTANVDGQTVQNGMPFYPWVVANGDVIATGKASGHQINIITAPIKAEGPDHVYGSRPYFSVEASSPSGALIPSANALLAIFDVRADAANDITFSHSAGNKLIVGVNRSCTSSVGTVVLKDEDGNILDSQAGIDLCAISSLTFTFNMKDLVITKGTTKRLYIYGNTSGFTNHGDLIQLWLDSSSATNVTWSINGDGGNYGEADIIFRGGIYANSLIKG